MPQCWSHPMKRVLLTFAASWFLIATVVASAFAG
jgi:hypothetical protein